MLERNSQISCVRIYASSGTSPGRGGPFGAAFFVSVEAALCGRPDKRAHRGAPLRKKIKIKNRQFFVDIKSLMA
jgi:hypothetical protein